MAEAEPARKKPASKPKCIRCGNEHTVSALGHWHEGWWTCSVCNVRWQAKQAVGLESTD